MQISNVSNQNFGHFVKWEYMPGMSHLKKWDIKVRNNIERIINEEFGDKIKVYGCIGFKDIDKPYKKSVRLYTYPLKEDMSVIMVHKPNARSRDYRWKSNWFSLYDRFLTEGLLGYLGDHYKNIRYCVKHPDHHNIRHAGRRHRALDIKS